MPGLKSKHQIKSIQVWAIEKKDGRKVVMWKEVAKPTTAGVEAIGSLTVGVDAQPSKDPLVFIAITEEEC